MPFFIKLIYKCVVCIHSYFTVNSLFMSLKIYQLPFHTKSFEWVFSARSAVMWYFFYHLRTPIQMMLCADCRLILCHRIYDYVYLFGLSNLILRKYAFITALRIKQVVRQKRGEMAEVENDEKDSVAKKRRVSFVCTYCILQYLSLVSTRCINCFILLYFGWYEALLFDFAQYSSLLYF